MLVHLRGHEEQQQQLYWRSGRGLRRCSASSMNLTEAPFESLISLHHSVSVHACNYIMERRASCTHGFLYSIRFAQCIDLLWQKRKAQSLQLLKYELNTQVQTQFSTNIKTFFKKQQNNTERLYDARVYVMAEV